MKSLRLLSLSLLAGLLFTLLVLSYSSGTAQDPKDDYIDSYTKYGLETNTADTYQFVAQDKAGNHVTSTIIKYAPDVYSRIFLPLVWRQWGLPANAPLLNPIDNPNVSYNYTVSWSPVEMATSYILEEDDNAAFSSPATVYDGVSTSAAMSVDSMGSYYYRVKAKNALGESGWSNIQSTLVTSEPLACPEEGRWVGVIDGPESDNIGHLHFQVVHTPECQVEELGVSLYDGCLGASIGFVWSGTFPISDLYFDNGHVSGSFISNTEAVGDLEISYECEGEGSYYVVATWQAYFDSQK